MISRLKNSSLSKQTHTRTNTVSFFSTSLSDFPPPGKEIFLLHFIRKHSVTKNKPHEISVYSGNPGIFNQDGIPCLMKIFNRSNSSSLAHGPGLRVRPLNPPAWGTYLTWVLVPLHGEQRPLQCIDPCCCGCAGNYTHVWIQWSRRAASAGQKEPFLLPTQPMKTTRVPVIWFWWHECSRRTWELRLPSHYSSS